MMNPEGGMSREAVEQEIQKLELVYEWLCDPSFGFVRDEIERDIYKMQADTLEMAKDWDTVMFNRGWAASQAYFRNLREITENQINVLKEALDVSSQSL